MPDKTTKFLGMTDSDQFVVQVGSDTKKPKRMLAVKQLGNDFGLYNASTGVLVLFVPYEALKRAMDMGKVEPYRSEMERMKLEWRLIHADGDPDPRSVRELAVFVAISEREYVKHYALEVSAALGRLLDDHDAGSGGTAESPADPTPSE